jgi:hypothetical protein
VNRPGLGKGAMSPIENYALIVWRCLWETIFQSILFHSKSDMVGTCSSHPLIHPAGASRVSNNQEMVDFMGQVAKSMEVLRKQNEDLNTRLTVAEVEVAGGKENAKKGVRRRSETIFAKGSGQLLLVNRTRKARSKVAIIWSRMKSIMKNLVVWSLRMVNHAIKGLVMKIHPIRGLDVKGIIVRSLLMRDLAMRRLKEKSHRERRH